MDIPITPPRLRRRLTTFAGAGIGAVALVALALLAAHQAKPSVRTSRANVTVGTVQQGLFHDVVVMRAKVVPREVIYLDSLEGGQVQKVMVEPGDAVVEGQPLVQFRNPELELEVLDRESRLVESITQLQAYEKQLQDGRTANQKEAERIQYEIVRLKALDERRKALLAKGFLSKQDFDTTHDELAYNTRLLPLQLASNREQDDLRERQLPQITAELANLQESLKITRQKLDALILRAPVAGRLTDIDLKVGEIRNRGQRLGQITPATGFKLEADLDEFYLDRIQPGQTGQVDLAGAPVKVRVSRVDPQVKNAVFHIEMTFDQPAPAGLLPGQSLDGRLTLGGDRPALVAPAGAFLERSGGDWAMVVSPDGRHAERRKIRIGRRSNDQVEVLSGLKAGERIITSDYTGYEKAERIDLSR
jgi:HlyD family secretion protein